MTGKEIACTVPAPLPGMPDDEIAADVARVHGMIAEEAGVLMLPALPGAGLRGRFENRARALRTMLRPISESMAEKERAAAAIALMLNGFLASRPDVDAEGMTATYVLHLDDLPLFAIERACNDAIRKRPRDLKPDYAPSSARLNDMARACVDPLSLELYQVRRVLGVTKLLPTPMSPERQEEMHAKLSDLAAELGAHGDEERARRRQRVADERVAMNQEFIRREWEALGLEPLVGRDGLLVSVSLASKYGKLPMRAERRRRKRA